MKTDDLVSLLATGTTAIDRGAVQGRFAAAAVAGLAAAVLLTIAVLGANPQLGAYLLLPMHWVKVAFAVTLAGAALAAALRLARPGMPLGWTPALLALPVLAVGSLAGVAVASAAPAQRAQLLFGNTWATCPLTIALLSVPALVLFLWAMRAMAPTRLRLAGAAAGLFAGAAGAAAYTLHCPELAAPFIATWYLLGVLVSTAVGAMIGPRVLRW